MLSRLADHPTHAAKSRARNRIALYPFVIIIKKRAYEHYFSPLVRLLTETMDKTSKFVYVIFTTPQNPPSGGIFYPQKESAISSRKYSIKGIRGKEIITSIVFSGL
jgi:hypothetical protein